MPDHDIAYPQLPSELDGVISTISNLQPRQIPRKVVIYYQTMTVPLKDLAVAYLVESWLQMETLWQDKQTLQQRGLKVMAMLGGACPGSFIVPDDDKSFQEWYKTLYYMLVKYKFDGIDLDIEEPMSQNGINRLVDRLRADFGPDFIITLAPVATALQGRAHLSGFDYLRFEGERGDKINFYNTQFYNGRGSLATTKDYDAIMAMGFPPPRVLPTLLTHRNNGTAGFIEFEKLRPVLIELRLRYPYLGGVAGWEYFNSDPGGHEMPYQWSALVARALALLIEAHIRIQKLLVVQSSRAISQIQ
ncbi:glycoside hydrolase superfamily [Aspergillus pseudocaelatus]|uniref:Glycoside hydrolase superfamily n=1 Tax=Aspergillus pseudocaelatus TaxID=1825620 RepID=A0ABQ6W7B6_9EURO|nr:glycoside hydrolase superfamily [Aspergillus pseudocaelatus]